MSLNTQQSRFSPTAIASGSSAIVKVSGQNSFRTLWFSGVDPSWAAKRFRGRFHQGSTKVLQVSWCLWFSGADPSWAAKRFRGRFHQGSTGSPSFVVSPVLWGRSVLGCQKVPRKVSPRLRGVSGSLGQIRLGLPKGSAEGFTKASWCLWFSGADPSWAAKRFREGSSKVRDLVGLLGQIPFVSERFCRGPPHHFFTFF